MARKAVISDRIYLDSVTPEEMDIIEAQTTYEIIARAGNNTFREIINNFRRIKPNMCSVPSGRIDLIDVDYEVVDKRVLKPVEFPTFKGSLRESQQEVYDAVNESCMINAFPSWGKTYSALAIAAKLGQKTLVVTHTTGLRDQWIAEIEKVFGIEAGVVGSGKYNIKPIIVVGNVQSLVKVIDQIREDFGTLILDEMHHVSAATFSKIVDKSKARYKIGLSGTLIRKDKKHIIFQDYFGFNIFKPEKENSLTPQIVIVDTNIVLKPSLHWSNRVTDLEVYNEDYRHMVVDLANNAASKGYKVLVVGSRVDFLKWAAEQSNKAISITGEMKSTEERAKALKSLSTPEVDILYGTMSIFSEGISQNDLSCLILATPINNEPLLTQLIGRIIREAPGKKQPLVIDINLKGNSTKAQANTRMGHYIKQGYQVRILKK